MCLPKRGAWNSFAVANARGKGSGVGRIIRGTGEGWVTPEIAER